VVDSYKVKKTDIGLEAWNKLKPKIDVLITRRINLFHDALLERGQINSAPKAQDPVEDSPTTGGSLLNARVPATE
jgi:hypothetical protein